MEGLKSWRAVHLSAMFMIGLFYPIYIASVYKPIAQDELKDSVLTIAGAIGSVCNGTSRVFWASLMDRFSFRSVYACLLLLELAVSLSIYYVRDQPVLYPIWVGLSYWCEGGHFSMFATAGVQIFGIKNGGTIFSVIFLATPVTSTLSFILIKENLPTQTILWVGSAMTAFNLVLLYFFNDKPFKPNRITFGEKSFGDLKAGGSITEEDHVK